ncbi:hypothetical protein JST97_26285 [bacterium]|nr:hypothetical protein [bacterium]
MKISSFPTSNCLPRKLPVRVEQKPVQRDQLGIRHDDLNDVMMGAGAVALFGGMFLRSIDPCLGNMVAASAGLFLGAALLR